MFMLRNKKEKLSKCLIKGFIKELCVLQRYVNVMEENNIISLGRVKRKNAFGHAQIVRIYMAAHAQSIMRVFAVHSCILQYPIHYENTPIKIYRQFFFQKNENFQIKNLIFFLFLLKT